MGEWTSNDYANIITISAAAISSVLMVVFKSRCLRINFCCGLWACDREVKDEPAPEPEPEPTDNP